MNLVDARSKLAAVLAPVEDNDPNVSASFLDSVDPPALIIGWDDPMLTPNTSCIDTGTLVVLAIASRINVADGQDQLDELVAYTLKRLRADGQWRYAQATAHRAFEIAKTMYLGSRITIPIVVTIE